MKLLRGCIAVATICCQTVATLGLYDGTDDDVDFANNVHVFDSKKNFRKQVLHSDEVWLVQFYDPDCEVCQEFAPMYAQLAALLKGVVRLGAVDAASDGPQKRIASDYGVSDSEFPTMKIFAGDKGLGKRGEKFGKKPIDVHTNDPNLLIKEVFKAIEQTIQGRMGGNKEGAGAGGGNSGASEKRADSKSKVVQLTASNFSDQVYSNNDVMFVAFAAPWCGHCKQLLPEWEKAATKLDGTGATLGWVDATAEESLAQEYGVQSYPTIKVFPGGGGKSSNSASDYQGAGMQASHIVQAALDEVDRSGVPKEIPELANAKVMQENCKVSGRICVFFALPHILDTGADGRNKYRDIMAAASKAVRGMNFASLWFEGGSQPDLETSLELTFGFPAVAAYSVDKRAYAVHHGSFTEANVRKFLTGLTTGRQSTYAIPKMPAIETVEPWDGKDGVLIEEESLADIMGWDDEEEPEL